MPRIISQGTVRPRGFAPVAALAGLLQRQADFGGRGPLGHHVMWHRCLPRTSCARLGSAGCGVAVRYSTELSPLQPCSHTQNSQTRSSADHGRSVTSAA